MLIYSSSINQFFINNNIEYTILFKYKLLTRVLSQTENMSELFQSLSGLTANSALAVTWLQKIIQLATAKLLKERNELLKLQNNLLASREKLSLLYSHENYFKIKWFLNFLEIKFNLLTNAEPGIQKTLDLNIRLEIFSKEFKNFINI